MLRDYQIDICSRVREAFEKHRSVMMQMPTGTGKTVVLAEMVRQYLGSFAVRHCTSYGGRVLIVAHRIELIEQTGEHLERYDIDYGVIAGGKKVKEMMPVMIASIQTLSAKLSSICSSLSPSFVIIDEAHHAVAKTYRLLWDAWPEARFLGLTATPYRLSGEGFTDLFDVLVDSWTVKRFIAEGWLSAYDYYSIRPESDEQRLIDNLKKRGADGDFQMKEMHETLDVAPCIERLFESFERFAYDKKGIVYTIDIAHAEHIAEFFRGKGVAAYAISSKTPLPERKLLIEGFRKGASVEEKGSSFEEKASEVFEEKSSELFENHPPSPSLPLKKGLHRFPLNPLSPQGTGDLKPGRPGLYSQTSSRPCGVARELPTQQSCDCLCAEGAAAREGAAGLLGAAARESCDCLTQEGCDCFIQVLVSVDLFSEGVDCPDVEFIQMARPTLSLAKYLQMVGRGLRAHQGKECVTIIDNVGLYRRFGLPSGERDWERYFEGLKDEKNKELKYLDLNVNFDLNIDNNSVREERGADLVKIIGHEGMATRFEKIGKEGFERKRKDVLLDGKRKKVWIWRDTLTGITFERHPVVVDFKGVEMMTDDGLTFYPRIRSKWVDEKSGINRKALETQVGDGFGWMKKYVSLREPDKVYELQEAMENGMRVYKDEDGKTFFQQDPDCPLVNEEKAGGKKAFMALCDKRKKEWEEKVMERRRDGFININGETVFKYEHRPVERTRGFVNLVYDGDLVYITNIHEERFIAYHNWEIRADDGVCTIGNKLYLKSKKDGKALRISKRSGDFQMFVVNVPVMAEDNEQRLLVMDAKMMIINRYGKNVECQRV